MHIRTAAALPFGLYNLAQDDRREPSAIGRTMKAARRPLLPFTPLFRAYLDAGPPTGLELSRLPGYGRHVRAVLEAPQAFFSEAFLDSATEQEFQAALGRFYEACVQPPLQAAALGRRAGFLRHALAHLLRCPDPVPLKAERCLAGDGPYHVAGLGPVFWSALIQALDPTLYPGWTPAIALGLRRLGLLAPHDGLAPAYVAVMNTYARLLKKAPRIAALHLDHFFSLAGLMYGRDLWSGAPQLGLPIPGIDLAAILRQERAHLPLRRRLKERGQALAMARKQLEAGLAGQDGTQIGAALAAADPAGAAQAPLDWKAGGEVLTLWVGRLWEADDPYERLEAFWQADALAGAGLWLPAAVLHLRAPQDFHPWSDAVRQGYACLADGADRAGALAERYRLFNEGVHCLRAQQRLHPLEAPAFLAAIAAARAAAEAEPRIRGSFAGFCPDTFRFLEELAHHNSRTWMLGQRDRYRFAVRAPLVELCRALAERYIGPVLRDKWGWDMETVARSGRALTSIVKNDYGRSVPYQTALWITFCRCGPGRRSDAQFFVRLDAQGLSYGLRLGRDARAAGRLFRHNVQEQAELVHRALAGAEALADCRFGHDDDLAVAGTLSSPGDLRAWAAGKSLVAGKQLAAGEALLRSDDLVGEILLTFDRLLPAYACAVSPAPEDLLGRRAGGPQVGAGCTEGDFCRATSLPLSWLRRARSLLELKRQLILQGVPGTGKTFVARLLARLLTGGREEAVRLVQFHPAYSYEEFVEGIKARSVEVNGRHEVTYPVEDGLLSAFAAEASRAPAEPYVLIIDEINRGNLPRVFGELLYLLEYRGQSIALPYSKRGFRLPPNLYLIGTMNAADRSVALVDQALRRRFSFLEMPPDAGVLAAWLRAHPPRAGADFAARVVALFERLNKELAQDLGPHFQVGHSYFMLPELDEARLQLLWEHHVGPLLEEYCAGQAGRLTAYDLNRLWNGAAPGSRWQGRRTAGERPA